MASSNFSYSGNTSVIAAKARVSEITTSGKTRRVRVRISVWAEDYSGNRDASYSVRCAESGTDVSVGMYQGFYISGSEQIIFDETFDVSIAGGSSKASISLSFTASLKSPSAGTKTISGSISTLNLTAEPAASASIVSLGADSVQMGKKLLISISRDDAACTHILKYTFGGVTRNIADNVASSYGWAVPDLASLCANAVSGNCVITCVTYREGSYIGQTTANVTLTVQPPAAPSIVGNEVTMGIGKTISCTRESSNFTVRLVFTFGDDVSDIASGKIDECSWTPGYSLAKQIPNLTYGTGTLKCTTYNGTAMVGERTTTIRVVVPENDVTRPKFTAEGLILSVVTDLTGDLAELYIRGKTGLKAEFSASSEYSTIQSFSVSAGSVSAQGNPAVIDVLVNEGDVRVTAKVTDARGFSATVTASIYVLPYRKPKIAPFTGYNDVICERAKATGELSSDGTYLAIKAGKSFSSFIVNGVERNACQLRYRYKVSNAADYNDWVVLLGNDSAETELSVLIGNVVSSTATSYNVEISALDVLGGEHSIVFQVMTEAVSFVLYDGVDGAGFGKYPEEPHVVDIASHMTLRVRGKLEVLGSDWVSLALAGGVYESSYEYGRGLDCQYQVKEGNHVYAAFNCSFVYQGTAVTINAAPIPEEYRPQRTVCGLCPVDKGGVALVTVAPDGYIQVQQVSRGNETGEIPILWIDGYLDYWT